MSQVNPQLPYGVTPEEFEEVARIEIVVHRNGMITLGGAIGTLNAALDILDHAKDCVRSYHRQLTEGKRIIIPEHDVSIRQPKHHTMELTTAEWSLDAKNLK